MYEPDEYHVYPKELADPKIWKSTGWFVNSIVELIPIAVASYKGTMCPS